MRKNEYTYVGGS